MKTLKKQIGRHSVALVSLAIALSSLACNTWRNEQTEANRNVRAAGIEPLLKRGELDRIVFLSHYDEDKSSGNAQTGWSYVRTARDLGSLMPEPATTSSLELFQTWARESGGLGPDDSAAKGISDSIDGTRNEVLAMLAGPD